MADYTVTAPIRIEEETSTKHLTIDVAPTANADITVTSNQQTSNLDLTLDTPTTGQVLRVNSATTGGWANPLEVKDKGVVVNAANFSSLNFTGASVSVTDTGGGVAQVAVSSGVGAALDVKQFNAYMSTGLSVVSKQTVPLDTTRKNTGEFVLSAGEVTINSSGEFYIIYHTTVGMLASSSRSESTSFLEINTGAGFTELLGTRSYMYHRLTTVADNTSSGGGIFTINAGDIVRIRCLRTGGGGDTYLVDDASSLTIFNTGGSLTDLTIQEEGVDVGTNFGKINFVGASVTATDAGGGEATVTITNPTINVEDEGVGVGSFSTVNFVGSAITATDAGGGQTDVTVSIPTSAVEIQEEGVTVAGGPHETLNFIGDSVTVTNAGGAVADVTVVPVVTGAASSDPIPTSTSDEIGLLWRDALSSNAIKVLSASEFAGRFLGIDANGDIAWVEGMANPRTTTAFGELLAATLRPVIQTSFINGKTQELLSTEITENGGTVTFDEQANLNLAVQQDSFAQIRSRRELRYKPGQGSLFRGTAVFDTPQANTEQLLGLTSLNGTGLFFGYIGTSFGVLRRYAGKNHIHSFTITASETGNETATVTLDGTGYSVSLTDAGGDANFTASEIALTDFSAGGWVSEVHENVVYFIDLSPRIAARNGTYSFSSPGNATATVSLIQSYVAVQTDFVPQASWNGADILDGNGLSGTTLDTTKGNVYQIKYQWLGYGTLTFFIESANTNGFQVVHTIDYPNNFTVPSLAPPSHRATVLARTTDGSTPASTLTLKSPCLFGAIEGDSSSKGSVGRYSLFKNRIGLLDDQETHFLTLRNNYVYNNRLVSHLVTLVNLSITSESRRPALVRIRKNVNPNPTLSDPADYNNWQYVKKDQSSCSFDDTSESIDGGDFINSFTLASSDAKTFDLREFGIELIQGESVSISVETSNIDNDYTVSLTWFEEFE